MSGQILIFAYHFTVIAIILMTALATIGGMAKIGIFKNIGPTYTKVLVGALLVELVAAFIGIYKTLPALKMNVSEKYRFEIKYTDIVNPWIDKLQETDADLVEYFIDKNGLETFVSFKKSIDDYLLVSDLSRIGGVEWINYYKDKLIGQRSLDHISLYTEVFDSSPVLIDKAEKLLHKYTRLLNSSTQTGLGVMWASLSGDKLEGIVVFEFPGDLVPTVLEFEGSKAQDEMKLSFTQKSSAFPFGNQMFLRKGGVFTVKFKLKNGVYEGKLKTYGLVTVQLWEL